MVDLFDDLTLEVQLARWMCPFIVHRYGAETDVFHHK